jgi:flagellar biosynthesis protein FlhF
MYLGNTFIEQYDFNQEIVDYILDDAFSKDKDVKYMPEKEVLALVKNYFRDYKYHDDIKETKCITIVGPTGTGKTTTLAKLAAREYLLKGKNVAFITMDTYRIGAVEQLKTYSNILGIPIEIVIDPSEMPEKVEKFKDYDLILIDAVGINYRDDEKVKELKSYFSQIDDLSTYLALNMTLDFRNIKDIIHYYSPFDCVGVILTKIDEVIYYDSVWNYLCDYHMPIGYLCNGQDVPDDILEGSFENIVHMIKKGKELKSR